MRRPRVHYAARRRGGGVAVRGARAAVRAGAANRGAHDAAADDPEGQARIAAFRTGLGAVRLGRRPQCADRLSLGGGDADLIRKHAAELAALAPDVILQLAARASRRYCKRPAPCRSCSRIVPDPVGAGFVDSLARPGGNATGFSQFEYGFSGKWLELLKEIAPTVNRVAVLREPGLTTAVSGQFAAHSGGGAVPRRGAAPRQCARRRRDRA